MKSKYYIYMASALLFATACELDNFNEPDAILTGQLQFNGQPVPVARNQVRFELWQSGYELNAPIDVAIAQDGTYSARLFSGAYKLTFLPNEGPFKSIAQDTIFFDLNGNTNMPLEVAPYYLVENANFTAGVDAISASCDVVQELLGADAKDVERVSLIVNRTQFVDANSGGEGAMENFTPDIEGDADLAIADASDISDLSNISITVPINPDPIKPSQNYYFARIGVKIAGVEDWLYSQVQRVDL